MISCPNRRLSSWKKLVQKVGENKAYLLWAEYDGNVPDDLFENLVQPEVIEIQDFNYNNIISEDVESVFENIKPIKEIQEINNKNKELLFGSENVNTLSANEVLKNLIDSNVFEESNNVGFFLEKAMNLLNKSGTTLKLASKTINKEVYDKFDVNSVMMFDSITNTVYVTDEALKNFDSLTLASSFIHEVVHSTTVQAYFNPKTFEEKDFKKFIDNAYNQYKFLSTKRDVNGNLSYGFTNQAEFIAEIFSNPSFRAELETIEKNFFQKFIDSIRRLFELARNGFNNELIKSAILFEVVDEFATRNKSNWKGTLVYDPRYDKFSQELFNKVQQPASSTLQDKIDILLNEQLNNIDVMTRRAISTNKKFGTKNETFIHSIKTLEHTVNQAIKTNKFEAIHHYTDFMITQIEFIFKTIKNGSTASDLEQLETIERYKSYLGASDMLQPIMDTLNDTRVKDLTDSEKEIINAIQDKLTAISGAHDQIKSKFRTHTTQAIRKELKSSYYSEKVVQDFRAEIAKEYPSNSKLTKKEWVNQEILLRQDELDARVEKDIDDVIGGLSTDVDYFDKALLTTLNTKSRLIQIVVKVIAKMKSKIDALVSKNDFELDKLYQDLIKEKGKYDITNLYDTTKDGETFLKGEYSVTYREKYINEYSKTLDEVNKLKETSRVNGFNDFEINQFAEVKKLYGILAKWRSENTIKDINGTHIPHPKYKNKLNFSKAEQAIYNKFIDLARNSSKTFGESNSLIKRSFGATYYSLPYATVSNLERITSGRLNVKDSIKQKISNFTDWKVDELDNNSQEMYRQDGTRIYNIPIMYRNNVSKLTDPDKFKELIKEQSFDLLTLMRLEHYNQSNFKVKSENEMLLNSFVDISRDKEYLKTQPGSNNLVSNLFGVKAKYVKFKGVESNEYKRLQTIINQSLYNKFYEESFKIAGKDINKIVQSVNKYTSFLGMSLNYFNAPVNVLNAEFQTFITKLGKDIDSGKLREAHLKYAEDLPNIIADAGRPNKISFVNQLNLLTDVFGGLTHEQNDFVKNTLLKGITDPHMLQIFQNGGEHMVQSVFNLALVKSIKVMNDKGQYVNKKGEVVPEKDAASLYDMIDQDIDTKQISFNNKFTYTDKSSATKWNEGGFENVRLFIKKKIFDSMGEYDKNFQTDVQKYWLGQLLMMYKKFIIPLGIARYRGAGKAFTKKENLSEEDRHWNESLQQYEEGFYTTTFRFISRGLMQNLVKMRFDLINQNWNELSEYEKANLKKGIVELSVLVMLQTILVPFLVGAASDGDDEELMFLAMTARRLEQELSFYTDLNDAYKVTKNPIASMNLMESLINVARFTISPGIWFSETKDGTPRAYKALEKIAIPTALRPDKNAETILQGMNRGLLAPYQEGVFYQLMNN